MSGYASANQTYMALLKVLHNNIYKNKGSNTGLLDFFECVQSYIADDCFFTG